MECNTELSSRWHQTAAPAFAAASPQHSFVSLSEDAAAPVGYIALLSLPFIYFTLIYLCVCAQRVVIAAKIFVGDAEVDESTAANTSG
jgi:hypothetical protein